MSFKAPSLWSSTCIYESCLERGCFCLGGRFESLWVILSAHGNSPSVQCPAWVGRRCSSPVTAFILLVTDHSSA